MSLTVEQIRVQALARASQATNEIPGTHALAYRRIGVRQQDLFSQAGRINTEFYGSAATANLVAGAADFADLADPLPQPAYVQAVIVANPGTSAWPQGWPVSIVPVNDWAAGVAPRATLRDLVLRSVNAELNGVNSVTMYYARRSPQYGPDDGAEVVELASPWDELLVIDLGKHMLRKSPLAASPAAVALLSEMDAEEKEMLGDFMGYVRNFAPLHSRFSPGV